MSRRRVERLDGLEIGDRFETFNNRRSPSLIGTVYDKHPVNGIGVVLDNPPDGQPARQYFHGSTLVEQV